MIRKVRIPAILFFLLTIVPGLPAQDTLLSGIRVSFTPEKSMFPCRWRRHNIDAQADPLTPSQAPRAVSVVEKGLTKYPPGLPGKYINRVYVLKSIRFYGYPYGGTYSKKTLYLTLDEGNPSNTDRYLEDRFHHELSSILWKENIRLLDLDRWRACNPAGFVYGEGGIDAIRSGLASMDTDPGYFDIGFLNRYGMADIEQDINVLAQNLFNGGKEFWKIVGEKERIRGKVMLLIGFYHAIDPLFTESYFRNLNEF